MLSANVRLKRTCCGQGGGGSGHVREGKGGSFYHGLGGQKAYHGTTCHPVPCTLPEVLQSTLQQHYWCQHEVTHWCQWKEHYVPEHVQPALSSIVEVGGWGEDREEYYRAVKYSDGADWV